MGDFLYKMLVDAFLPLFSLSLFNLDSFKEHTGGEIGGAYGVYIGCLLFAFCVLPLIHSVTYAYFSKKRARVLFLIASIILFIWPGGVAAIITFGMGIGLFISSIKSLIVSIFSLGSSSIGIYIDEDTPGVCIERNTLGNVRGAYINGKYYDAQSLGYRLFKFGSYIYHDRN